MHCALKPGGLFFLGFPVDFGEDRVVWNAHRVYGPMRLALATANFELLGVYGDAFRLKLCGPAPKTGGWAHRPACAQPILVLRKSTSGQGGRR